MERMTRRRFIGATTAAAVAAAAGGVYWWRRSAETHTEPPVTFAPDAEFPNPLRLPAAEGWGGTIDSPAQLTVVGKQLTGSIIPGKPARMLGYEVNHDGRTFVNPTLRVRSGAQFRVKFWNALDQTSIIHWHGLKVDGNNDGHPHYAVPGGATYDYQFTVINRAGTYWYHPHPHGFTGAQVYRGMAGLFIVEDEEEIALRQQLDLASGATDIPLVLQDRRLDTDGAPIYAPSDHEWLHGYLGDQMLVNLTPRPYLNAATRIYRLRILNASNARVYRLAFMHADQVALEFNIIATDGGLLPRAHPATEVFLAPGERVEVLLDLRGAAPGDVVFLKSLAFDSMHGELHAAPASSPSARHGAPQAAAHAHGDAHAAHQTQQAGTALPDGAEFSILKIQLDRKTPYDRQIPATLSHIEPLATGNVTPRPIVLDQRRGTWRINGLTYREQDTPVLVKRGSLEVWEFRNIGAGMPHPMHVHGFQFQVLERNGSPEQIARLAVNDRKLIATDLGWKDTVLVWPGETVRIALDFSHTYIGNPVYMVHCHNLEHEDRGMMLNFKVVG